MTHHNDGRHIGGKELCLFAGGHFLLAATGYVLAQGFGGLGTFSLCNVVSAGLLLNRARKHGPLIFLICGAAAGAGALTAGMPWQMVGELIPANLLQVALTVYLVRQFGVMRHFESSPAGMLRLLLAAALPPLLSAVLGGLLVGGSDSSLFITACSTLYAGSAIAMVAALPPVLLLLRLGPRRTLSRVKLPRDLLLGLLVLTVTVVANAYLPSPFIYIAVPLMIAAANMRFEALTLLVFLTALLIRALIASSHYSLLIAHAGWPLLLAYLPMLACLPLPLILAASINQSHQRERQRRKVEQRFHGALQFAAVGLALADKDGRLTLANHSFCKLLDYNAGELLGLHFIDLVHPEDRPLCLARLNQVTHWAAETEPVELRVNRANGGVVWTRLLLSVLLHNNLDDGLELIIQLDDVTARRAHQHEITVLGDRLGMATRAGKMGVWEMRLDTRDSVWDAQMFALYGQAPCASVSYAAWRALIEPADFPAAEAAFYAAIRDQLPFDQEFRIKGAEPRRTVRAVCTIKHAEDGRATHAVGLCWDISRQKEIEQQFARNAHELQTIIDHMPAVVGYWGPDLHNRFGNRAYIDWFGMTPEEIRGKHIREVIGEELYARNLPMMQAALAGQTQRFERTIVDPSGSAHNSIGSYVPDMEHGVVKGFYAFLTDITPIRAAELERQTAQRLLRGVIDAASEFSIIAVGLNGIIRVFSTGAERMLGYRAEEMIDVATPALIHDAHEVRHRAAQLSQARGMPIEGFDVLVEAARRGVVEASEWTYVRKDGSRLPVSIMISATRDEDGNVDGFLGIAKDITLRKKVERELRAATEQAQAASSAKSQFVASMSHELRTPMNAVLGMTHLLANTALSANQKKYLDMIRVSGQSLLAILNDILDFSKIEAGRMELEPAPFRLDEVIDSVAGIMSISAGAKEIELCIGVAAAVPLTLVGDAQRLQQILVNLASNAIKFTASGEIILQVDFLANGPGGPTLFLTMRDTGIGMSPAQQARLFQPFSQGDSSVTRRFGGTGLGLAITGRLVEIMGGNISVTSTAGSGSEFRVSLPLGVARDDAEQGAHNSPLAGLRLLAIDDSRTSLACLDEAIASLGAQVCLAGSLREGQAHIKNARQPFDAVLLDGQLMQAAAPRELEQLRSAALPLLLMTSTAGHETLVQGGADFNAERILLKPVTRLGLQEALGGILRERRIAAGEAPPVTAPARPLHCEGARILLVEDNEINQVVARVMLEQVGAQVTLAHNGQQAVDFMRDPERHFDLVLMDVQMPVLDGYSATRIMREELGLGLPILAMTAGVLPTEREQCIACGMDDFIAKPIDAARLFTLVSHYLQPQPPSAALAAAGPAAAPPAVLFDPSRLFKVGGDDPGYRQTMLTLINDLIGNKLETIELARGAWLAGRSGQAAKLLHTLRGSIGTIGAQRLAGAALELEILLGEDDHAAIEEQFRHTIAVRDATLQAAECWMAQQVEADVTALDDAQTGV